MRGDLSPIVAVLAGGIQDTFREEVSTWDGDGTWSTRSWSRAMRRARSGGATACRSPGSTSWWPAVRPSDSAPAHPDPALNVGQRQRCRLLLDRSAFGGRQRPPGLDGDDGGRATPCPDDLAADEQRTRPDA